MIARGSSPERVNEKEVSNENAFVLVVVGGGLCVDGV